ncbi:hypothetical protein [Conyzicola sp.]|uniref:hypothetical protein n=1 Tax=Conyzicola sp. TaxID=1969404 RepID=UPI003988F6D7
MFLTIFAIGIVAIILIISALLIWRERRAGDYQDHLDPRDQPGGEHAAAMAAAYSSGPSSMGGGAFGP